MWYWLKINWRATCRKKSARQQRQKMQKNLFTQDQVCNSNLAEIEIKYSTRVKPSEMEKVVTSYEAYEILKKIYPSLEHREYFYMLCLNRNNKVLGYSLISMGGLSGTFYGGIEGGIESGIEGGIEPSRQAHFYLLNSTDIIFAPKLSAGTQPTPFSSPIQLRGLCRHPFLFQAIGLEVADSYFLPKLTVASKTS